MKLIFAAAAVIACFAPAAAFAQTTPAPAAAPVPAAAEAAPAAKFNLDTPIEVIVADDKAKAVLTADMGMDLSQHPAYEQFKGMSLRQVQPYSQGAITDEILKKTETDLAAIK